MFTFLLSVFDEINIYIYRALAPDWLNSPVNSISADTWAMHSPALAGR